MRGFRVKLRSTKSGLIVAALALAAGCAAAAPSRDASFLEEPTPQSRSSFSGLAAEPELIAPAPVAVEGKAEGAKNDDGKPAGAAEQVLPAIAAMPDLIEKVEVATLPNISAESIGAKNLRGLGADMWKGTPRALAYDLLTAVTPTSSPALNDLARRLLATAAVPPEGTDETAHNLTATRLTKLIAFGDSASAWSLAAAADPKLIDDETFRSAAEAVLTGGGNDDLCAQVTGFAQTRTGTDWQKTLVVCALRSKDPAKAQIALEVMRTQGPRDDLFLQIADKLMTGDLKKLPTQLTPLTPSLLALLRLSDLPLPSNLFARPANVLVPALLRATVKQEAAQLVLAERSLSQGLISGDRLADVYASVKFSDEVLADPVTAQESGVRLRALLYRTTVDQQDKKKRAEGLVRFMQTAPAALLANAGGLLDRMMGDLATIDVTASQAPYLAQAAMLAGKGEAALVWQRAAQAAAETDAGAAITMRALWPQFVLAGLEGSDVYKDDLNKWLEAATKDASSVNDKAQITSALLLLYAAGFDVPDTAWRKLFELRPVNEKKAAFSPVLMEKLRQAALAGHVAETALLAVALAGEGEISVPVAVEITRALRQVGLKGEAATFARQQLAQQGEM